MSQTTAPRAADPQKLVQEVWNAHYQRWLEVGQPEYLARKYADDDTYGPRDYAARVFPSEAETVA